MAVGYTNDLTYSSSDLVSVYNPNVLIFNADLASASNDVTATVILTSGILTHTFTAVMYYADTDNSKWNFRLDLTNILPSFISKLYKMWEESGSDAFGFYKEDSPDDDCFFESLNIDITVSEDGEADQTDDYDIIICRSVNNWGAEGGSNLYDIWNINTVPTYHIWDTLRSQFGIYFKNAATTNARKIEFNRAIGTVNGGASQAAKGMYPVHVLPDMTDKEEMITDGDPFVYDSDVDGFFPQSWTPYGTRDANNYFTLESGNMLRIYSLSGLSNIGVYQDVLTAGKTYEVEIVVYDVTDGGIRVKDESLELNEQITTPGTFNYTFRPSSDGKFYIQDIVGACNVTIQTVSVLEVPDSYEKQEVTATITDDTDTRTATVIIHKGCDDGINIRYLSRHYGILQWQFNRLYTKDHSASEGVKILNNIDDMTEHTSRYYVESYEEATQMTCVYKGATSDEQAILKEILSSPFVEMLINDIWVRVFPTGSHTTSIKKATKDFVITFKLPNEYTQSL